MIHGLALEEVALLDIRAIDAATYERSEHTEGEEAGKDKAHA
jgi:hypothetical protein